MSAVRKQGERSGRRGTSVQHHFDKRMTTQCADFPRRVRYNSRTAQISLNRMGDSEQRNFYLPDDQQVVELPEMLGGVTWSLKTCSINTG